MRTYVPLYLHVFLELLLLFILSYSELLVLFYLTLFYYYPLDSWLFFYERQKKYGSGWEEWRGGIGGQEYGKS